MLVSLLATICGAEFSSQVTAAIPPPPGPLWMFELLFNETNDVTGFPFSAFPGLNGSDKTKFVNDQLINRDELIHLTAFLEVQLYIAIQFSPTLVELRQQQVNNCKFLLRHFHQMASATDSKGNRAISIDDIERLYAPPSTERGRVGEDRGNQLRPSTP